MEQTRTTQQTISELEEIQEAGVTLGEAVKSLHKKENVEPLYIWPAIMEICSVNENEARNLTNNWCE